MLLDLVIFDMDGVLADTEPLHAAATLDVLRADGFCAEDDLCQEFLGSTDTRMFEVLRERLSLPAPVRHYVERKRAGVFERVGRGLLANPGVHELLLGLKMRSIPCVVASSSDHDLITAIVRAVGIHKSFARFFSGQDVTQPKPAPDIFLLAAKELRAEPSRCLVIEDSPAGIAAARAAGMQVLGVRTEMTRGLDLSAANRVVDSLAEFDLESIP